MLELARDATAKRGRQRVIGQRGLGAGERRRSAVRMDAPELGEMSSDTQFHAIRRHLPLRTPVGG
jgi:hypothetical protein